MDSKDDSRDTELVVQGGVVQRQPTDRPTDRPTGRPTVHPPLTPLGSHASYITPESPSGGSKSLGALVEDEEESWRL
jgi:hypothetical protein